jgi:tRNA nucleotidyltransferase (CCA-adding enzyme)
MKGYKQDNPHHSLDLYEHSRAVVESCRKLNLPIILGEAGWFHDMGKPFCREMGEDGFAHYKGHENVSAYMFALHQVAERTYTTEQFLKIIFIINYHMRPYNWTQKSYQKDEEKFGNLQLLKLFHKCDAMAH